MHPNTARNPSDVGDEVGDGDSDGNGSCFSVQERWWKKIHQVV